MTLDRGAVQQQQQHGATTTTRRCASATSSPSAGPSSFLHGVKKAVILLCPGDPASDQASAAAAAGRAAAVPGRAVRVQFTSPTTSAAAVPRSPRPAERRPQRSASVASDRYQSALKSIDLIMGVRT